ITGGARGQGLLEARLLVERGAHVVLCDVLADAGHAAAQALGPNAVFVQMDVTQEADWRRALEVAQTLGQVYGLVNNAGIYDPAPIEGTSVENFERHYRVNQLGPFLGMKIF